MTRAPVIALALAACTPAPATSSASTTTTTTTTTTASTTGSTATTAAEVELGLPIAARAVALLDFNGDGHIDLLASADEGAVQVLHGRGDGSFEPPRLLGDRLEAPATAIVVGDFDGDGAADLAARYTDNVAIIRGGADETLHFAADPAALVSLDADRDGLDDLFLTGKNILIRRHGHASGHLQLKPPLGLGGKPFGLIAADLDDDGVVDLVAANRSTDDLSVLLGDGLGGFHPQRRLPVGRYPHHLAAADLDGDGVLDLVVHDEHGLVTLRGLGGAQFAAPHGTALPPALVYESSRLVVCERDGDPRPEVVVTRSVNGSGWIAQLHADADAHLEAPETLHTGAVHGQIACADLDGDALGDLVFTTHIYGDLGFIFTGAP